jgi:hypothetical protein
VEQTHDHTTPAKPWLWKSGVSANPYGREGRARRQQRIDGLVTEWSGGRALEPVQRDLVRRAAELFLYARPRTIEEQSRVANTIGRLVAQAGLANARKTVERSAPRGSALARHLAGITS